MTGTAPEGRFEARLGAVQALYQMEASEIGDEAVIAEFEEHRFGQNDGEPRPVDAGHFERVVRGVVARQSEIDSAVNAVLRPDWPLRRLDSTVRAILRAGAFEILACDDIPPLAAIDEYVEIAHAFFAGDEPGFVNGALDQVARRSQRIGAAGAP